MSHPNRTPSVATSVAKRSSRRTLWPSETEWEYYKRRIVEMYISKEMKLSSVVESMKEQYGFNATNIMYKKRFEKWKVRRYTDRETKLALLSCIAMRQRLRKQTIVMKHGRPWNMEHTLKRGKLKWPEEDDLCAQTSNILKVPAGYACVTPPPELHHDTDQVDPKWSYATLSSLYNLKPSMDPPTNVFLSCCYASCTLRAMGRDQAAEHKLWQASQVFSSLVQNLHEHLLACINTLCISLFLERRCNDAVDILGRAKDAAQAALGESHPVVLSISNMMWEASGANRCPEVGIDKMRAISEPFRSAWSCRHPFTILADYKLAWRLAMGETSTDEKFEALQILSRIQTDADMGLGSQDMLPIAIITTKARVLEALDNVYGAQTTMAKGIRRMWSSYPSLHPYRLEGQSRHADLLRATGQTYRAEQVFIQVALGRAEVFGPNHQYSRASKHDVLTFLSDSSRDQELQAFNEQMVQAIQAWQERKSPIHWWII